MSQYDRDIDGKLNQKLGNTDPQIGDWKPEKPGLVIGCLIPALMLVSVILGVLL